MVGHLDWCVGNLSDQAVPGPQIRTCPDSRVNLSAQLRFALFKCLTALA